MSNTEINLKNISPTEINLKNISPTEINLKNISPTEINLIKQLLDNYKIEYHKIEQYVKYASGIGIGYLIADTCPKCNSIHADPLVKMLFCSYEDIMPGYNRSKHYIHLCNDCHKSITDIYNKIDELFIGKSFNIRRSSGIIELWRCYKIFPIIKFYNQIPDEKIPTIVFIMLNENNYEKHISLDMIIELNQS